MSDRLEGVEVVEAVLGMVEGVSLGKVQVVGEKAVVTWPPVASPVRDDLVSGGAGMWPGFFSEIQLRFFSSDCSAKRDA